MIVEGVTEKTIRFDPYITEVVIQLEEYCRVNALNSFVVYSDRQPIDQRQA